MDREVVGQLGVERAHEDRTLACEDGLTLGRKVGQRAANLYLQPLRK